MKKAFVWILAAMLLLTACASGGGQTATDSTTEPTTRPSQPVSITVLAEVVRESENTVEKTTFSYDASGFCTGYVTTRNGQTEFSVSNQKNEWGEKAATTEIYGSRTVVYKYTYDAQRRLVKTVTYEDTIEICIETRVYGEDGNLAEVKEKDLVTGRVQTVQYLYEGGLLKEEICSEDEAELGRSYYTYDAAQRLSTVTVYTDSISQTQTYTYDGNNSTMTVTDEGGQVLYSQAEFRDEENRTTKQVMREGGTTVTTTYTYQIMDVTPGV